MALLGDRSYDPFSANSKSPVVREKLKRQRSRVCVSGTIKVVGGRAPAGNRATTRCSFASADVSAASGRAAKAPPYLPMLGMRPLLYRCCRSEPAGSLLCSYCCCSPPQPAGSVCCASNERAKFEPARLRQRSVRNVESDFELWGQSRPHTSSSASFAASVLQAYLRGAGRTLFGLARGTPAGCG